MPFATLELQSVVRKEKGHRRMKRNGKRMLWIGVLLLVVFVIWPGLIQCVDVQAIGQNGTEIGFASWNRWFHSLFGVHMTIYTITDWLGLAPVFGGMLFGVLGFVQLVKRRSLFKVDYDILVLGIYYLVVIVGYLVFEMIPINYRPILIEGRIEASYPSSTTLLVLSVMPTLAEQLNRRLKHAALKRGIRAFCICFSAFMVIGRLIAGVHWFTDIVGAVFLSSGLYCIYKAAVLLCAKQNEGRYGIS